MFLLSWKNLKLFFIKVWAINSFFQHFLDQYLIILLALTQRSLGLGSAFEVPINSFQ